MKCHYHKKEREVNCAWCGTSMCPDCVAGGRGRKVYCEKCVDKLGNV